LAVMLPPAGAHELATYELIKHPVELVKVSG